MSLPAKWRGPCLAVLVALASVQPAAARDLTAQEEAAVERFSALMRTQDWPAMIEVSIPPRIMLKSSGQAKERFTKVIAGIMAMAKVNLQSSSVDLSQAARQEHADGTPYRLIPTETVTSTGGEGKTLMRTATRALLDGDAWYLVRGSDARQVGALREAYPEYQAVTFPYATMELVKE